MNDVLFSINNLMHRQIDLYHNCQILETKISTDKTTTETNIKYQDSDKKHAAQQMNQYASHVHAEPSKATATTHVINFATNRAMTYTRMSYNPILMRTDEPHVLGLVSPACF